MNPTATPQPVQSIYQECDFCKVRGVLDKSIFNKDGWYFCKSCQMEIEYEMKKRALEAKNLN